MRVYIRFWQRNLDFMRVKSGQIYLESNYRNLWISRKKSLWISGDLNTYPQDEEDSYPQDIHRVIHNRYYRISINLSTSNQRGKRQEISAGKARRKQAIARVEHGWKGVKIVHYVRPFTSQNPEQTRPALSLYSIHNDPANPYKIRISSSPKSISSMKFSRRNRKSPW